MRCFHLVSILIAAWAPQLAAEISVSLEPSIASPAKVGAIVTWTATAADPAPGKLWYRFRSRRSGWDFHVIKDYGPENTLDWTARDHEGAFEIEISVRNRDTGETQATTASYEMLARGERPVITPTAHPLVFLYSAPPCAPESRMRVKFRSPEGMVQRTPYEPCLAGLTMNFYLAGMRAETAYQVHHTIDSGDALVDGPPLTLTTGRIGVSFPAMTVVEPPRPGATEGILVQAALFTNPVATDLNGNVLWYYAKILNFMTEPVAGGRFMGIVEDGTSDLSRQVLREFDLAGVTLRETNVARVNEQLAAMGRPPVGAFHHEARRLAAQKLENGNYHFGCGLLADLTSESMEIDPVGNVVYALHASAPESVLNRFNFRLVFAFYPCYSPFCRNAAKERKCRSAKPSYPNLTRKCGTRAKCWSAFPKAKAITNPTRSRCRWAAWRATSRSYPAGENTPWRWRS